MTGLALGLDFGTDSVRALLVDTEDGREIATAVAEYPRWKQGLYCVSAKDQFRQHPLDYIESLEHAVNELWQTLPAETAKRVIGISFDTTGSTPVAVDKNGCALALKEEFAEDPNAMFVLWKDHTAVAEAAEITRAASDATTNYLKYEGGIYSSEWYWAKALHVLRASRAVAAETYMFVEHCDWMPALLTDTTHPDQFRMGRCAAGHKVMWHESWGGYPPDSFFSAIDTRLAGFRTRLPNDTFTSDKAVGGLSPEWSQRLGLPEGTPVGFGAFDCHMGAVAANVRPGVLTKVMGTSTCDITVAHYEDVADTCVKGICGQVDGSVLPGMIGLEAGQSAFGDLYAWFKNVLLWPLNNATYAGTADASRTLEALSDNLIAELSNAASNRTPGESGLTALDWINGRRTPDADQTVAMAITGIKMGSDAPALFRSMVEATAFGARAIIERFREEGIAVDSVVAIGGISKKSDFVMQLCADIWNCKIDVLESDQSCALGAAIFAATVGNVFATVADAQKVMASPVWKSYQPNPENKAVYDDLYARYLALGQYVDGGHSE
ncbi:ribulokinase [Teredinibacter turnerae]|uniref:ribulokinase n=1 Tax=Teredinibacter turnerae TaxID=2426 RepID=UPI0005F83582|nr:ribulokinase [Teredinibacter turnerae]